MEAANNASHHKLSRPWLLGARAVHAAVRGLLPVCCYFFGTGEWRRSRRQGEEPTVARCAAVHAAAASVRMRRSCTCSDFAGRRCGEWAASPSILHPSCLAPPIQSRMYLHGTCRDILQGYLTTSFNVRSYMGCNAGFDAASTSAAASCADSSQATASQQRSRTPQSP